MRKQPDEEWIDLSGEYRRIAFWLLALFGIMAVIALIMIVWITFDPPHQTAQATLEIEPPIKKEDRLGPSPFPYLMKTVRIEI